MPYSEDKRNVGMLHSKRNGVAGCSIMGIPETILVTIILKLPLKGIVICKGVCKDWRRLISDPQFAKLHFAGVKPYPLLRLALSRSHVSRILYLVELPEIKLQYCDCHECGYCAKCDNEVNMKLKTKFKIPLRNAEHLLNSYVSATEETLHPNGVDLKRKPCVKVKTLDHNSRIVNSCNGFMCLSEPVRYDPVIVCNPVTGEFINLPKAIPAYENSNDPSDSGFGFCPKTNQYKMIRMFKGEAATQRMHCPVTGRKIYGSRVVDIHTLGTKSWKRIGYAPGSSYELLFPTYLNVALHWLLVDSIKSDFIVSFDLAREKFQLFPSPPIRWDKVRPDIVKYLCLGVLNGRLCVSDASRYVRINIWVMRVYGVRKSWTKKYCIDTDYCGARSPYGMFQPMYVFNDESLLIFHHCKSALIYYHPKEFGFKYIKIRGYKSMFEAVAHIPSLISLKDAVMGDNVEVLNINSRCAEFKLQCEDKPLCLEEEIRDLEAPAGSSSEDC